MLKQRIKNGTLIFDGAMGTYLQKSGMAAGEHPETLNISQPALIQSIHLKYLKAGCDVLTTNTFGASPLKYPGDIAPAIEAAVANAKAAIDAYQRETGDASPKYIALDLGPIGQLLAPMGTLSFDDAYESYRRQAEIGIRAGCDLILIETQTDIYEAKAAVLASKASGDIPVICTMSFETGGRTFMGTDIESMATILEDLGVDALGLNCSFGPKEMLPLVEKLIGETSCPILIQPNAGLPKTIDNITVYDTKPLAFKEIMTKIRALGVTHIGGCCGTDEQYIAALKEIVILMPSPDRKPAPERFRIASYAKTVTIGGCAPVVIGERLNPTGKKRLKEALRQLDKDYILKEAISQIEQGAAVLDLNIGLPEIDEAALMPVLIREIQGIADIPIQIDSSDLNCLEAAAKYYNGKPMINSVSGKRESLDTILPIVKRYGACVLGLTLDDNGIPSAAEARFAIAEKIVREAVALGIPKRNIIIDCLALTASAQQSDVIETIKAIQLVKSRLGVPTVLGVSNVSFGLPYRQLLNQTFYIMAMTAGLDAAIINPGHQEMMSARDAFNVLNGWDEQSKDYIQTYGHITKRVETIRKEAVSGADAGDGSTGGLYDIILKGLKGQASETVEGLLKTMPPMAIVDEIIIPALNDVGSRFENGTIFLPQLIQSAETVQQAFERLKAALSAVEGASISKGKLVLATVHHDVHDIGKNIVKVILQNYGFEVVDLGKDVPPETILEACVQYDIQVVGLSALMTSTVTSMEKTIALIKKERPETIFIVGGAVLNPEYAQMIRADHYAKDARETAQIVQQLFR
ncbi:homocysteine S-methyltransferase family protein [Fusibacter paucivorans]